MTASVAPVEADLKAKLAREPHHIPHYLELARLYYDVRRYDEAEATLRRALVLKPDAREVYSQLFLQFQNQHQFEKGLALAEAWALVAPSSPDPPTMRAGAYYMMAEDERGTTREQRLDIVQRGLTAADAALALKPDHAPAVYVKLGLVYVKAALASESERPALEAEKQALTQLLEKLNPRLRWRR